MTLKRWIGTRLLLGTAVLLVLVGASISDISLEYGPPRSAVSAGGKAVMIALAPLLCAVGLVFGAVALSRRTQPWWASA